MAGPNLSGWDVYLERATRAVNTWTVVALGFTPFELLFGIQLQMLFEFAYPKEEVIALQTFSIEHYQGPSIENWKKR